MPFSKYWNTAFGDFEGYGRSLELFSEKKIGHTDISNYLTCFRYILLSKIILSRKKQEKGARWPLLEIF